ncbi:MAG TPA: LLM class flavin-dependent oxidoreductase [Thermomicrobiales bacterium]|nr:LLM class flavin-dependent oxidoreductase [Thermomicrobiales bacterium]
MNATASKRPLKIGVQLPEVEYVATWPEIVQMARRTEALGYDSLWIGDHLLYRNQGEAPKAPWEAWSMMAALAAVTERVEIGPLVACTGFHNPAMLAKKAATLEEISGGRLILGLGAGWNKPEYDAYGYPYDHRVSRFEEAFTIIRQLLREGRADFHGQYCDANDCLLMPRGPRREGPPIMIGSQGARMLEITLPYVESWNAWYAWFDNRPEKLAAILANLDAACRAAGRDPATLERTCALLVAMPGAKGRAPGDPTDRGTQPLRGTTEELAETMRAFARLGIGHIQLVLDPNTAEGIEAFAPVLAALDEGG